MRRLFLLLLWLLASASHATEPAVELFAAASQGKLTRLQSLLAQGIDVDARTTNGRTALMGAAFFGNERVVRWLLGYGADVNAADNRGITPLMDSVSGGWTEITRLLLATGADIKATDKNGQSALDKARQKGATDILNLLNDSAPKSPSDQIISDDTQSVPQDDNKDDKQQKDVSEETGKEK